MKLTEKRLKEIIKEEIARMQETPNPYRPVRVAQSVAQGGKGGVAWGSRHNRDYTDGRDRFAHLDRAQTYEQYLEANKDEGGEYIIVSIGLFPTRVFRSEEDLKSNQNETDYFDFVVQQGLPNGAKDAMKQGKHRAEKSRNPKRVYAKDMKNLISSLSGDEPSPWGFRPGMGSSDPPDARPLSDWLTQILNDSEKYSQGEE
jgi:hypothetical protein